MRKRNQKVSLYKFEGKNNLDKSMLRMYNVFEVFSCDNNILYICACKNCKTLILVISAGNYQ